MTECVLCQRCGNVFASCYIEARDLQWFCKVDKYKKGGCKVIEKAPKEIVWCNCDLPLTNTTTYGDKL